MEIARVVIEFIKVHLKSPKFMEQSTLIILWKITVGVEYKLPCLQDRRCRIKCKQVFEDQGDAIKCRDINSRWRIILETSSTYAGMDIQDGALKLKIIPRIQDWHV